MNLEVVFYGLSISLILYVARLVWLFLFRVKEPLSLLYIAPRGLITVLLFFQLQTNSDYAYIKEMADGKFDPAILLVVILVTCLIMTFSLIRQGKKLSSNDVSIVGDSSDLPSKSKHKILSHLFLSQLNSMNYSVFEKRTLSI